MADSLTDRVSEREINAFVGSIVPILARRRFSKKTDLREVTAYVEIVLRGHDEEVGGYVAREAEALIRWMLGETDLVVRLSPDVHGDLFTMLMIDLARSAFPKEVELDQVLAQAERVAVRLMLASMPSGRAPQAYTGLGGDITALTPAGQWLQVRIFHGRDAAAEVPIDATDPEIDTVLEAVFELAVKKRFDQASPVQDIARFVANVRRRYASDVNLSTIDLEMRIRKTLGESVPTGGIASHLWVETRPCVIESLADAVGLLDSEVDALIGNAERLADERRLHRKP